VRARAERSTEVPKELTALQARIVRLCERLQHGDPDLPADGLQAAIEPIMDRRRRSSEPPLADWLYQERDRDCDPYWGCE
jgi:hypothetical protein